MNYTLINSKRKMIMISGVYSTLDEFLNESHSFRNKDSFFIEGLAIITSKGLIGVECYGVDFLFKNKKEFSDDQIETLYLMRDRSGYASSCSV